MLNAMPGQDGRKTLLHEYIPDPNLTAKHAKCAKVGRVTPCAPPHHIGSWMLGVECSMFPPFLPHFNLQPFIDTLPHWREVASGSAG
jgi:hypothetical protein